MMKKLNKFVLVIAIFICIGFVFFKNLDSSLEATIQKENYTELSNVINKEEFIKLYARNKAISHN